MKIALVTYSLEIGGVESVLMSLAGYFKNFGYCVDFVETSSIGKWSEDFANKGYNVHSIVIKPFESRLHHVNRIAQHLEGYDVLLLNDAPFAQSIIGLLPSHIVILPILHNNLDSMIQNAVANRGQWQKIVCVSPSLQNIIIEKTSILREETVVISNGVTVNSYWPKIKLNFDAMDSLKILFVGRVEHQQKGVLYLPEIIKTALTKNAQHIHLTVIGDGPSMADLKQQISVLQLNKHISILGSLDHENVIRQMHQHNVLLMPSHFEGHPIVLMEAMAQGLVPVVTHLFGHTDHVVKNRENGYLCNIDKLDDFSDAIVELYKDKNRLKKMSKEAWETVFNNFSKDSMGSSYIELINTLKKNNQIKRTNKLEKELLDDLPGIPHVLVRPIRKILRLLGLWHEKKKTL